MSNIREYYKRQKVQHEASLTNAPFSQQQNIARTMAAGTEYGDSRRAPAYTARLHTAKYLTCDPLLKDLFFPVLTMAKRFGFCSTTGIDALTAALNVTGVADGSDYPVIHSKASGVYRGIAMFTLRSEVIGPNSSSKLNATPYAMGVTSIDGTSRTFNSAYRRFNSRPDMANDTVNGSVISDVTSAPTVTNDQFAPSDLAHPSSQMYVSEVGNILELETKAVQSTNFQHAIGSTTSSEGTTTLGVQDGNPGPNWSGSGNLSAGNGTYYANLKNTTIRICDGYLELDITNGKSTSTFIEVVIHAHRKHSSTISTQSLLNAIANAVNYQQTDRNVDTYYSNSASSQNPGGWQAFWDPTYPLLGCKSQHRKPIDDIAREVHRSNHMLGPGQSKMIKINLGSLYYDIGNKSTDASKSGSEPQPNGFLIPQCGVGALNVTIGHSGVQQLSAPVNPTGGSTGPQFSVKPDAYDVSAGEAHIYNGGGFWVGKTFCPSEIVVGGNYVEKFYPSYVVDKERRNWSDRPLMPPANSNGMALPAALPVMDTVGTVDLSAAIAAQITSPNTQS